MIDFIHLTTSYFIPEDALNQEKWTKKTFPDGTVGYSHVYRSAIVMYYPETGRWSFKGKPIALMYNTQVLNVDDVYGADLFDFINEFNQYIQTLAYVPLPDICDWDTQRIDYCFNIKTPFVEVYISLMNEGFRMSNTGSRVNHVEEKKLSGSVYVKTKADYRANERRNYVLNYYDKHARLVYLQERGATIPMDDWAYAENVLRLEVQCGFQFIKTLCGKLGITRRFGDMLSYAVAYCAETMIYQRVFKADVEQDFYLYKAAKDMFKNPTARKVLELSAEHHPITDGTYNYGRQQIKDAGVYPFAFLRKGSGVEVLPNPLKLIMEKLVAIGAVEEWA